MPKSATPDLEGLPETPGVKPRKIAKLDAAVADWRDSIEKRKSAQETEKERVNKVADLMHTNELTHYHYYDGDEKKLLTLEEVDKIKLSKLKNGDSETE